MKRIKILIVSVLAAVITLCGVIFAGCGDKDGSTPPPPAPPQKALSVKTIDNADSDEKTHEITATEVEGVPFAWSINWENPASEWATGKTLSDYIEFTTDGYKATVKALQAFGERAIISATWGEGNEAYTLTKSVDYAAKFRYELSDNQEYYILTSEVDICTVNKLNEIVEFEILSNYNGLSVKEIGESAFDGMTNLCKILIPNGIVKIGANAFRGCEALKNVILPETLENLSSGCFLNCKTLTEIFIPKNVSFFGRMVFSGCSSLISITFERYRGWKQVYISPPSIDFEFSNKPNVNAFNLRTYGNEWCSSYFFYN